MHKSVAISPSEFIQEKQPLGRRRSLVDDARSETAKHRDQSTRLLVRTSGASFDQSRSRDLASTDNDLTEEAILLGSQPPVNEALTAILLFSLKTNLLEELPVILRNIKKHAGDVDHLETRPNGGRKMDVFVKVTISRLGLLGLVKSTRQGEGSSVTVLLDDETDRLKRQWFPKYIKDLDRCNHVLNKTEPDLDRSHPGFRDLIYRARRAKIAELAFEYKHGFPIPRVDYTDEEIKTWGTVYNQMRTLYPRYSCSTFQKVFRLLEEECDYRADNIPQLQDVSNFLKKKSGFVLRPAAGLVSARDFLSSLAFRVFQCTQYVRHSSSPQHTPEPDCIHELLGHAPMLADKKFAEFSQEIGLASLGASDEDIEKLATVYWFTIEFGLCKEINEIRAYGAGLLSSYGELQHAVSGTPRLLPFDPQSSSIQVYQDQDFQDTYFVAESFADATAKIRAFVRDSISRQCDLVHDPYTESILEINSLDTVAEFIDHQATKCLIIRDAVTRLKDLNNRLQSES